VANGRLPTETDAKGYDGQPVQGPERIIDWNAPQRIAWSAGTHAKLFEIHVSRPSNRQLRVSGPSGVAFGLFAPGTDGAWRSRTSAVATGIVGGTTYVKFSEPGVWALVLFQDTTRSSTVRSRSVRGGGIRPCDLGVPRGGTRAHGGS
jgi:hypothetical protein